VMSVIGKIMHRMQNLPSENKINRERYKI